MPRGWTKNAVTKSGMMVGLGESWDEVLETMQDLRDVDCDLLTIGQYLRDLRSKHAPLARWYTPGRVRRTQATCG